MKRLRDIGLATALASFLGLPSAAGLPCMWPQVFPEIKWDILEVGTRLGTHDALLTCKHMYDTVKIRSNIAFDIRVYSDYPRGWTETEGWYVATIAPGSLMAIPQARTGQADIEVTVLEVHGRAFVSWDRALIKQLRPSFLAEGLF